MKHRVITFERTKNGERRYVPMTNERWMFYAINPLQAAARDDGNTAADPVEGLRSGSLGTS